MFGGPFIVRSFATHFNAIKGSRNIANLYERTDKSEETDEPVKPPLPRSALALSTAAVGIIFLNKALNLISYVPG